MKTFHVYRDIRVRALIFGLPVALFALQMVGIIGSLLVVIFSFSFGLVIGAMVLNGGLYVVLLKLSNEPQLLNRTNVLPKAISNKKTSALCYEDKS